MRRCWQLIMIIISSFKLPESNARNNWTLTYSFFQDARVMCSKRCPCTVCTLVTLWLRDAPVRIIWPEGPRIFWPFHSLFHHLFLHESVAAILVNRRTPAAAMRGKKFRNSSLSTVFEMWWRVAKGSYPELEPERYEINLKRKRSLFYRRKASSLSWISSLSLSLVRLIFFCIIFLFPYSSLLFKRSFCQISKIFLSFHHQQFCDFGLEWNTNLFILRPICVYTVR